MLIIIVYVSLCIYNLTSYGTCYSLQGKKKKFEEIISKFHDSERSLNRKSISKENFRRDKIHDQESVQKEINCCKKSKCFVPYKENGFQL